MYFSFLVIIQYNSNCFEAINMDNPQRDAVSETTQPSEQVEVRSNLSTLPNRSESNDRIFEDAPTAPQRSSENYAIHSQRQVHQRSVSLDSINNEIPIHSSAPPILNQVQQKRENLALVSLGKSERKLELKTFDQDWQNNLKQEQEERQKYHQLINHNNEPLLSQKSQNNQYLSGELLLSPKSSKSQTSLQLKQSQISNEVKNKHYGVVHSQIINQQSGNKSNSSSSNIQNNAIPLFQMGIKQESQSNLLNFGFVKKHKQKNEVINEIDNNNQNQNVVETINANDIHHSINQQQQPMDICTYQQPMDIEKHHKIITHNNESQQSSKDFQIKIYNCNNDLVNSTTKNNDIYGISPSQQKNDKPQSKVNSQVKDQHTQYNPDQFALLKQKEAKQYTNVDYEQIIQQMYDICKGESTQLQRSQQGIKLLQEHIDFLFLKPLTLIGKQIIKDGATVILLIKIILLKENDLTRREILQKYLILTLASHIQRNHHQFIQFQQFVAKSKTLSNLLNNQSKQKEGESLNGTKITMNQSINPNQSYHGNNQSAYAENGSSIHNSVQKSPGNNSENQANLKVPVKRTLRNKGISPISGKVTRKTKYKSNKGKGKTTSKKNSKVKFQQQPQQSQTILSNQRSLRSKSRKQNKSVANSEGKRSASKRHQKTVKQDSVAKDVNNNNFGSKFTFAFRQNNKSHQRQLVQRRVSQRLAGNRGSLSKNDTSLDPVQSSKKRTRLSSSRRHQDQQIDIDYIKSHFRQIKIKTSILLKDFEALTPQDEEIVELFKQYEEIQQGQSNQLSNQPIEQNYNQAEDTRSITTSQGNTKMRLEQLRKNLSQYKVKDFPIVINRIVDPDINQHGIYALLQLGKVSQIIHNAKFALTPITTLATACKRHIEQDLKEAKNLVGNERDNIAYLQPTVNMLQLIATQKQRRKKSN